MRTIFPKTGRDKIDDRQGSLRSLYRNNTQFFLGSFNYKSNQSH